MPKNTKTIFQILIFTFSLSLMFASGVFAEEQRDLREGIVGEYPEKTQWGLLPRFKMNPDTGAGTGLKLKGVNVFGTSLYIDLANIYTVNQYQVYEFLVGVPKLGAGANYFYFMSFVEFDLIPDLRMFGVGNDTINEMYDDRDKKVGNEATIQYMNVAPKLTIGKKLGEANYIALQPFYREVWFDKGDNDYLPQAQKAYEDLTGIEGGKTPGFALSIIRSTRNEQWRPTKGYRIEALVEDVAPYFGSDFDYTRYVADVRQYFPLFGEYFVLALHARAETMEGEFNDMPWYELPSLGGKDSIRGYWENRFRGRSVMQTNTEVRYHIYHLNKKIWKAHIDFNVDGNVFYDAGRVFRYSGDWQDEYFQDWKSGYGFGFRFTTPPNLMGRMDIGFSDEETFSTYFNFGTVF